LAAMYSSMGNSGFGYSCALAPGGREGQGRLLAGRQCHHLAVPLVGADDGGVVAIHPSVLEEGQHDEEIRISHPEGGGVIARHSRAPSDVRLMRAPRRKSSGSS